eukprot:TRINITY_DN11408_c0_g1_i5.p2 TRINITY_DN11408_c0_g1~~TRINITY_DN11408_c0_g1_i5.p2  ORF type:complete len:103 (+),score=4.84 TRINITY_DN11408_c0_g1_i5:31-309(+)
MQMVENLPYILDMHAVEACNALIRLLFGLEAYPDRRCQHATAQSLARVLLALVFGIPDSSELCPTTCTSGGECAEWEALPKLWSTWLVFIVF